MSFWSRIEKRLTSLAGDLLPDDVRDQVDTARTVLLDGDAESAASLLEGVVAARPEHVGALSLLGLAELERRRPQAALDAFDRAVARSPDLADAQVGRGQACLALELDDEAVASFRAAVEHAGGDREVLALAYRGLGIAYRRRGELDKAIRELRKAVAESPRDAIALAALGDALHAHPDISDQEARKHLGWALEQRDPPPLAHLASGEIALVEGRVEDAESHFARAAEGAARLEIGADIAVRAAMGAGDAAAAAGNSPLATERYRAALELAPRRADVRARLGEIELARGDLDAALEHLELALALGAGDDVLRRALDVALDGERTARADALAGQVLATDPSASAAMIARARALASAGDAGAARAMYRAALERGADARAHRGLAELALAEGDAPAAAAEALTALRLSPADSRARDLLDEARRRELGGGGEGGVRDAFAGLERLIAARPELATLSGDVARAAADFERPLLVTVMGEFSSGKSSFVNAFIGSDVAPTGITPTTATINVVRYGRERGGRIVYLDDTTEAVPWSQLFARLRDMAPEEARRVARVDIMLPLETLERVNLVDTPGLNSILPEHEEVARGFIARADAVVWLFAAGQAGKASEREALTSIREQGVRVLGVLNKIDQLSSPDGAAVEELLDRELGSLLEKVVPVSARRALAGEVDSNWTALERALDERFFARANKLKSQAARRRLASLCRRIRELGDGRRGAIEACSESLADAESRIGERVAALGELVITERRAIATAVAELYRRAAREVIELVLPRRLPFGSNRATPADRDYLIALLESGFEAALGHSRRRVVGLLREADAETEVAVAAAAALLGTMADDPLGRAGDDAARLLEAEVYASAMAFLRGYLRGGNVEQFFRADLPKLDVAEDAVYHALFRDAPDVDELIARPLSAAAQRALGDLARRVESLRQALSVAAFDLEIAIERPALAIEALLERRTERDREQ
jgi:tetratricopeptide (TPR) repeat protein